PTGHCGPLAVCRFVTADNVGRNAPALTDRQSMLLRPGSDLGTVLAVSGRSPFCARQSRRCLAGVLGIAANGLVELFAVPLAEVYRGGGPIDADRARRVLALWILFRVVVAGICARHLLCPSCPPSP